ncbi:50S ribosomal protein L11 [bacterium]|nr:50S ribosomal protein L11 [bacterium]
MAKQIKAYVKVQVEGGQAKPAPPLGPALGQHGVQIMDFCRAFNDQTKDQMGEILPTLITIYEDRSFDFVVKSPPAAVLLMRAAGMEQGSSRPSKLKVATVTWDQCREIAEKKAKDLNALDTEAGAQIIAGTARSMGYIVVGHPQGRDDKFAVISKAEFAKMKADHASKPAVAGKKK